MSKEGILHKELCFKIQSAVYWVYNQYGNGHKEIVYANALEEYFISNRIDHVREQTLTIRSVLSDKAIGHYRPDFVINNQVLLEIKACEAVPKLFLDQVYSYLRVSAYELGLFVNFRSTPVYIKRIILTNDRKFNHIRSIR
jgi:GxxExxY protein